MTPDYSNKEILELVVAYRSALQAALMYGRCCASGQKELAESYLRDMLDGLDKVDPQTAQAIRDQNRSILVVHNVTF